LCQIVGKIIGNHPLEHIKTKLLVSVESSLRRQARCICICRKEETNDKSTTTVVLRNVLIPNKLPPESLSYVMFSSDMPVLKHLSWLLPDRLRVATPCPCCKTSWTSEGRTHSTTSENVSNVVSSVELTSP